MSTDRTTQRLIETIRQALDDHANPRRPDPGDVSCSYCAGATAAVNEVERRFIHLEDALEVTRGGVVGKIEADQRIKELEAERDTYRIEADCGMRDYDALELEHGILKEHVEKLEAERDKARKVLCEVWLRGHAVNRVDYLDAMGEEDPMKYGA